MISKWLRTEILNNCKILVGLEIPRPVIQELILDIMKKMLNLLPGHLTAMLKANKSEFAQHPWSLIM